MNLHLFCRFWSFVIAGCSAYSGTAEQLWDWAPPPPPPLSLLRGPCYLICLLWDAYLANTNTNGLVLDKASQTQEMFPSTQKLTFHCEHWYLICSSSCDLPSLRRETAMCKGSLTYRFYPQATSIVRGFFRGGGWQLSVKFLWRVLGKFNIFVKNF